ncbi:protein prenylyltransferase [Pseudovirgaria hyperparasitica]|uniref:Protein prenylyltransferase n=1 Tax=Pseudovirgaria hyperparasitica TaxID=470096 RepID=A0A6A6W021_9PEZI|nr:protein prenylyltransferase [Pseudovirgaria hyperparasitica]KAF2755893.1 protein prenylyltransferase [Pseudovirgaria hyperparasitica]
MASASRDAPTNGVNGHRSTKRFADVPKAVFVSVSENDDTIDVEVPLDEDIQDDPTELCTLLENEEAAKNMWMAVALGYAKHKKVEVAIQVLTTGLSALSRGSLEDRLALLNALCWMNLLKCRDSPRVRPDGADADVRTKDSYIQFATHALNEASKISPSYSPLFLARGVLYLLKASLTPPSRAGTQASEKVDTLRQAAKCFEDAIRSSSGKNVMALLGKARVQFALGKPGEALELYQMVLSRSPELIDPDPRIGIGCCFWELGHKDDAKGAWTRALDLNPSSKVAKILLGLYYLYTSAQFSPKDAKFQTSYKKAVTEYVQRAFKLDERYPLSCVAFGSHFLVTKTMGHVEKLARRAIDLTDIHAIASDGWYLLARKEHYADNLAKANEYYSKADQARGGDERGYLPAKFGAAQIKVLMQDFDGAKFRLEKIVQHSKSVEAMVLLGTLFAEDVFASQSANSKEDKSTEIKKAIGLLEGARAAWKDPKKKIEPDYMVLLNLARLYELESPEKSLQCLQLVEEMLIDDIPADERPEDVNDAAQLKTLLRELLPPQLLNNMACFHYQAEKYTQARELFQTALTACVKVGDKDPSVDSDALVTTISYNLARTYEAEGMPDEAKRVYEGLLERHGDYTDAITRLAYINLKQDGTGDGPKAVQRLFQAEPSNLEVRALYGFYLNGSKRRTANIGEDQEQRHYRHTLQNHEKHDRYSLVGMGNIYLTIAREMRRDTEQDKDKRRKMYEKAVEFFDKALQLDPKNAYAAQGIAIALVEDRKDLNNAVQIFTKVRETMKEASVFINLGHVYCELKQYTRAIENYEIALNKDKGRDPQLLACLGRVWLTRGKQEKSLEAMKSALEYSRTALEVNNNPDQSFYRFNIAFVQIQIAQLIYTTPESERSLQDVQTAASDLDEAIASFTTIANGPNPPFPKSDIEARANMGRNTMRKQLERAVQNQKEYEEKNAARLQSARQAREAEIKKREDEKRRKEEVAAEQRRKIAEERQRIENLDRELAAKRIEDDRRRKEDQAEEEARKADRAARGKGRSKRKKKGDSSEINTENEASSGEERRPKRRPRSRTPGDELSGADSGDEAPRKKKKRKLVPKSGKAGKFKSDEVVVDSDTEGDAPAENRGGAEGSGDDIAAPVKPRKVARVVDDEEDEDEDVAMGEATANGAASDDE